VICFVQHNPKQATGTRSDPEMVGRVRLRDDGADKEKTSVKQMRCDVQISRGKLLVLALFAGWMLLAPPTWVVDSLLQAEEEMGSLKEGNHMRLFPEGGGARTQPKPLAGTRLTDAERDHLESLNPSGVAPLSKRPVSKLGQLIAKSGRDQSVTFADDEMCGDEEVDAEVVRRKTLAIIAITYRAPRSFEAALKTWQASGMLDMADELILFINAPLKKDIELGERFGFRIMVTDERGGNIMAGPALAYAVGNCTSDYVLFMEKDFQVVADRQTALREMWAGVWHLARGVEAYRLRGKTDHPAEGMPNCCAKGPKPECPFNSGWRTAGSFADHMNWLFVYCDPDVVEHANGRVVQCSDEPKTLCYTSAESNWSNNPVLFGREWFNRRIRKVALTGENAFTDNRYFEFNVMLDWLGWRPPARICSSFWGIMKHVEIDQ
jgi:hypothetical protein